jgi:hypothetical protein
MAILDGETLTGGPGVQEEFTIPLELVILL